MKSTYQILVIPILILLLSGYSSKAVAQSSGAKAKSNAKINVYTTAENTPLRLSLSNDLISTTQQTKSTVSIIVDPAKTHQTFLGIGGAITDASAEVFAKLSPKNQQEFLTAYYDKNKGIGYSLARTNI
ncbi:glycosyl hydrolase, partial [Flavobacterium aquidurense]